MNKLNEINKAWLAGVIDGEGSIFIHIRKERRTRLGFVFIPALTISNSNLKFLKRVKKIIGSGYLSFIKESRKNWKDKIIYFAKMIDIKFIIKAVLKYLIIKKQQGKLMIKFLTKYRERSYRHRNYNPDSYKIYNQIKRLNKKGKN